ncbi:hypothetical protein PLESTF_000865300, partial [Pleodorina starrii]
PLPRRATTRGRTRVTGRVRRTTTGVAAGRMTGERLSTARWTAMRPKRESEKTRVRARTRG